MFAGNNKAPTEDQGAAWLRTRAGVGRMFFPERRCGIGFTPGRATDQFRRDTLLLRCFSLFRIWEEDVRILPSDFWSGAYADLSGVRISQLEKLRC
jgi:hypothetical protein